MSLTFTDIAICNRSQRERTYRRL